MKNKMKWTSMTAHWSAIINFIRKFVRSARMVAIHLLVLWLPVSAQAEGESDYSWNLPVSGNIDLNALPEQQDMWSIKVVRGRDFDLARFSLMCLSENDDVFGKCRTRVPPDVYSQPFQNVPLRFTRQGSGETITLTVAGRFADYEGFAGAITNIYMPAHVIIKTWILREELKKIPTTGIWTAHLQMRSFRWWNSPIGSLVSDITLNVTDHFAENAAIYFPQFGTATPRVDLNLHRINATQMSGRANLDMCLYDGGTNARSLQMKIEGSNKSGTGFQVINNDSSDALDYDVSMNYEGRSIPVTRGTSFSLDNVDKAATRPVVLPGQRQAVRCVPAPLTLITQPFNIRDKSSGKYQGSLTVTMLMGT
ncbi:fimbrial protein TcfD, partial [Salmonella enterica subsp. enterica]|nr:fimbrial protein TcfD [Salmonella enterica subsp. enterica serovar Javiana]